jgi:hypothetical protein
MYTWTDRPVIDQTTNLGWKTPPSRRKTWTQNRQPGSFFVDDATHAAKNQIAHQLRKLLLARNSTAPGIFLCQFA